MSKKHRIYLLCILGILLLIFHFDNTKKESDFDRTQEEIIPPPITEEEESELIPREMITPESKNAFTTNLEKQKHLVSSELIKKNIESEDSPPQSEFKKVKREVDSPKAIISEFPDLDPNPSAVSPKSTEKNMESEDFPQRSELVEESKLNSEFSEPIIEFERSKIIHSLEQESKNYSTANLEKNQEQSLEQIVPSKKETLLPKSAVFPALNELSKQDQPDKILLDTKSEPVGSPLMNEKRSEVITFTDNLEKLVSFSINEEESKTEKNVELVEKGKLNEDIVSIPNTKRERGTKIIHSEKKSEVIESIPKDNLGKEQSEENKLVSFDNEIEKNLEEFLENLPSSKNPLELEFTNLKDHEHRKLYDVTKVYLKKSARKIELSYILNEEIPLDYNLGKSFISSKFENETYQPLENTVFYDDSFAELCNKTLKLFFENEIDIDLKELKNIETDIHSYQTKLQNNLMSKNKLVEDFLFLLSIELKSITRILQNITNVVNKKISENKSDTKEVIIEKENDSLLIQLRGKIIKLHEDIIQFDQFYQLNR